MRYSSVFVSSVISVKSVVNCLREGSAYRVRVSAGWSLHKRKPARMLINYS